MMFLLAGAALSKVASSRNVDFARGLLFLKIAPPALSLGKALVEAWSGFFRQAWNFMHIAGVSIWRAERHILSIFVHYKCVCFFWACSQNRPRLFVVQLLIRISTKPIRCSAGMDGV